MKFLKKHADYAGLGAVKHCLGIGFKVEGKYRIDLHPRSGRVLFDISSDKDGYPDIMKRRIIELEAAQNEAEFDLPPGKYIATPLIDSGENHTGWVSKSLRFEVLGSFSPTRIPKFQYDKNIQYNDR